MFPHTGLPAVRSDWKVQRYGLTANTQEPPYTNVQLHASGETSALVECWHHKRTRNGAWSGGGPFLVWRKSAHHDSPVTFVETYTTWAPGQKTFSLGVVPRLGSMASHVSIPDSMPAAGSKFMELQPWYATGRARTLPGAPEATLGQGLVETALDGLPSVIGRSFYRAGMIFNGGLFNAPKNARDWVTVFRNLGSEHLNIQFGWKPFVKDLRDLYKAQTILNRAYQKLLKENRVGIHRQANLFNETYTSQSKLESPFTTYLDCDGPSALSEMKAAYTWTRTTTVRRWFKARYQYFIPESNLNSWAWQLKAKASLLGLTPTPELLWEVIPWSWLIDWFYNFGDLYRLLSYTPAENLYTDYAFIMESVKQVDECQSAVSWAAIGDPYNKQYPGMSNTFRSSYEVETKARVGGNLLFGLGITGGVATARQVGILAALGLSRMRL